MVTVSTDDETKGEYPYQDIFERDKFTCQYCGLDASRNFDTWWTANMNIDHVVPKKHGGEKNSQNLVVACRACNLYKGSTPCSSIEEAREIVNKKRAQAEKWYRKFVLRESV